MLYKVSDLVTPCCKQEHKRHCKHECCKEPIFARTGEYIEFCYISGEIIAKKDHQKPKAHDRTLHGARGLSVRKLKARNRDHDFSASEHNVRRELPKDGWPAATLDPHFNQG